MSIQWFRPRPESAAEARYRAEEEFVQATVWLADVWNDLYVVDEPDARAALLDRAAQLHEDRARLMAVVDQGGDTADARKRGFIDAAAVLRRVAATERALIGELDFPGPYTGSRIGADPGEVLLWVDLASAGDRATRAGLLLKLSALLEGVVGALAVETLTGLAETEVRLAAESGFEAMVIAARAEVGALLSPAELAQVRPAQVLDWHDGEQDKPGRERRQVAATFFVVGAVIAAPEALHWSMRDQAVWAVSALAAGIYVAFRLIRARRERS